MYTRENSIIHSHYDSSFKPNCNLRDFVQRVVRYDEDNAEIVTWEKVDTQKLVESNGLADDWKLTNLIKAGIDPAFNIRTGAPSRVDVATDIESLAADVESKFVESETEKSE